MFFREEISWKQLGRYMQTDFDYSNIRFYDDDDFQEVVQEMVNVPDMRRIVRFLHDGNIADEDITKLLLSFENITDFQLKFIIDVIKKVAEISVSNITTGGLENVDPKKNYVFMTNHRNIVLDASFLNMVMYDAFGDDFRSTAIAIGDNLLNIPWVRHIARINKSFIVERGLGVQQMLESSKRLSQYMRQLVVENDTSVWIASREGRTKDGNDITQAGLLKMFQMSSNKEFVENFGELHILPVAISYEFDPCDTSKVKELVTIANEGKFEKGPLDDFNSMFDGLMGAKGRVHYEFGKEIRKEDLASMTDVAMPKNEKIKNLVDHLDDFYHQAYKLWPINYVAADLLNNNEVFSSFYSSEDKNNFVEMMNDRTKRLDEDPAQVKHTYLSMFAYPVKNQYKKDSTIKFEF